MRSVHNGRSHFHMERVASEREDVCRYQVIDDDDDRDKADIRFGQRGDLIVPISITVRGYLTGRLLLVDE